MLSIYFIHLYLRRDHYGGNPPSLGPLVEVILRTEETGIKNIFPGRVYILKRRGFIESIDTPSNQLKLSDSRSL